MSWKHFNSNSFKFSNEWIESPCSLNPPAYFNLSILLFDSRFIFWIKASFILSYISSSVKQGNFFRRLNNKLSSFLFFQSIINFYNDIFSPLIDSISLLLIKDKFNLISFNVLFNINKFFYHFFFIFLIIGIMIFIII